jgi:lysozyme family protein
MADLFDQLAPTLVRIEGGFVNDPNDAGGETNFGITKAVARANGYSGAMRDMTRGQALAIYRAEYWARPGFQAIGEIAPMWLASYSTQASTWASALPRSSFSAA